MIGTAVKIVGMMCGMCEANISDAIRAAFPVKKVSSFHARGEAVILSEAPLDREKLRKAVDATGYVFVAVSGEAEEKKGLFSRPFHK